MKTVLVIGANSDMAQALILALAKQFKPDLFLLASRQLVPLEKAAQDLTIRTQIPCQTFALDVEDMSACAAFYGTLNNKPDCVIYCAGYLGEQQAAENNPYEIKKFIDINYLAGAILLEAAASDMLQNKISGVLIGISSVAGLRGRKQNYFYGAAKAAFSTFLSGLRNRLALQNIHVMTVLPGPTYTKMTSHMDLPKKLTATSEEVANGIVKGILKAKSIIFVKPIWRIVMLIICHIPEAIFKKMSI